MSEEDARFAEYLVNREHDLDQTDRTVLTGDAHDAYAEFCSAASALESHQKQAAALMERYKTALQRLSEQAAKAAR